MITIMGATGNTGRKIADSLLMRGEHVRALGRSAEKLAPLAAAGAEVRIGDAADATFLRDAFRGADAVYTLLPTDRTARDYRGRQDEEGEAIVDALRGSGVPHVVALSCAGADAPGDRGLIEGLHAQELRLRALAHANVLLLRPASFFENFYDQLPLIAEQGIVADSVARDLAIPMVSARDVASAAAQALAARNWRGVAVRELLGPRDLSYAEAAKLLGAEYAELPYHAMVEALVQAGLSASFAQLYVAMVRSFNEGRVRPVRTPQNTTPTAFEEFAHDVAAGFSPPATGSDKEIPKEQVTSPCAP